MACCVFHLVERFAPLSMWMDVGRGVLRAAGACEGVCACSTCHVILTGEVFDELPEASEDEEDMLDLAFGLTET